jgi:hypothetical protein
MAGEQRARARGTARDTSARARTRRAQRARVRGTARGTAARARVRGTAGTAGEGHGGAGAGVVGEGHGGVGVGTAGAGTASAAGADEGHGGAAVGRGVVGEGRGRDDGEGAAAARESEREREEESTNSWYVCVLCRVPVIWHSAKIFFNFKIRFAECQIAGTRQNSLCRVSPGRHSAKILSLFFVECHTADTRQSLLCRVSTSSTKYFFYFPNQIFCAVFLHDVDLHVLFWDNYNCVFNS